ncbi:MAG TPA: hypothetical protein VFB22_09245 [Candidatus Baltobacteraceae bacterium]|nr:hypothetical protein [Candidatus Baltobacteraceae bacterium]
MIALVAAAAVASAPLTPDAVLARYRAALATLSEPRVFAFEYTMVQTGTRVLEQSHRVFRSGGDERDETLAVNGTRSTEPVIRIFRGRPYRYRVAALAPRPDAYDFTYAGPHRDGHHLDYVFRLAPKVASRGFTFTQVTIDGLAFLPASVAFATAQHGGRGSVSFRKAGKWWVVSGATASARVAGGTAHEEIAFVRWRFPASLPASTFSLPRPLPPADAALP